MKTKITIDGVEQEINYSDYPLRYRMVDIFLAIAAKNYGNGKWVELRAGGEIIGQRND